MESYSTEKLLREIISWLPVKSILRFECVSKSWYKLIKSSYFTNLHLARSLETSPIFALLFEYYEPERRIWVFSARMNDNTINFQACRLRKPKTVELPPNSKLIGSCDGILCFSEPSSLGEKYVQDLKLYNPAIGVSKILPQPILHLDTNITTETCTIAFAYDSVSDVYKILRFEELKNSNKVNVGEISLVYSLKSNAWEIIKNPPWGVSSLLTSRTVFANNSFHWLIPNCKELKCFDLFTRRYHEMTLPEDITTDSPKLTVLEGKLCIVNKNLDLWIMNEYGNNKSWIKLFHQSNPIQLPNSVIMSRLWGQELGLACYKVTNKHIFIAARIVNKPLHNLVLTCCDLESKQAIFINVKEALQNLKLTGTLHWVESLIPLEGELA